MVEEWVMRHLGAHDGEEPLLHVGLRHVEELLVDQGLFQRERYLERIGVADLSSIAQGIMRER